MELLDHILGQGVPREAAEELADRAQRNPRLVMVEYRRRMISLTLPGTGAKFNEMVKNGVPPSANTDREFLTGTENGRQFAHNQDHGNRLRAACEANGGTTQGRKYIASLAKFAGDPEAWVSGRGDVQKVLEARGWGCEGAVNTPIRELEPTPAIPLAPDILKEAVIKEVTGKDLSAREVADTVEKVKDRMTPHWKKK